VKITERHVGWALPTKTRIQWAVPTKLKIFHESFRTAIDSFYLLKIHLEKIDALSNSSTYSQWLEIATAAGKSIRVATYFYLIKIIKKR